jgi:cell division transport system permease protein
MISLKRILKFGWKNFTKNISLNLAAVFIIAIVVFLAGSIFILNSISAILIDEIKDKVDISVYFKGDVLQEDILKIESDISNLDEVANVEYISKEMALEDFKNSHKDNSILIESISEIGDNPFLSSLNIKAKDFSQYGGVANFLAKDQYKDLIEKVDYHERQPIIEKVFSMTSAANKGGIVFEALFVLISIIVVFNIIKMTIYSSGEEISVMKLVGASHWFVRSPFLVQGAIIGLLSTIISFLSILFICWGLSGKLEIIMPELNLFSLFVSNIWLLVLIQFFAGVFLGMASSAIAVRKYLKI